eukprot:TRINITY_DN2749_c0_g1_i2.p1 TRINITY_DN2749_c0_g1~~TRINITY_DN2749_c0_g1_i2.p1  ORF type:complete len:419 (+),score=49.33 TRINITY_DN2749_c0_g1_i2:61-1317(+)
MSAMWRYFAVALVVGFAAAGTCLLFSQLSEAVPVEVKGDVHPQQQQQLLSQAALFQQQLTAASTKFDERLAELLTMGTETQAILNKHASEHEAHPVRAEILHDKPDKTQMSPALQKAIDYPLPDWLTAVQQAKGKSTMRPVSDMEAYRSKVKDFLARRPCICDSSDCEAHDALLHILYGMTGGVILEMGALDGDRNTTETYHLTNTFGFHRILIEADPGHRLKRRQRAPEALAVSAAVCDSEREVHFLTKGWPKFVEGIGEFMPKPFLRRWHGQVSRAVDKNGGSWNNAALPDSALPITCMPLGSILSAVGVYTIDFMILDIEGAELAALQSIDWHKITINAIVIECTDGRYQQFVDFMTGNATDYAYELLFDRKVSRNAWFVRKGVKASIVPGRSQKETCREEAPKCRSPHVCKTDL